MRGAFNADFYVTAATVIPVLYLALAVEGSALAEITTRLNRSVKAMAALKPDTPPRQLRLAAGLVGAYVLMAVAGVIVVAGVAGEIAALLALYHRSATATAGKLVLLSMIALLAFIAAGPVWTLTVAWPRLQWIPLKHAWRILSRVADDTTDRASDQDPASGDPPKDG